jgi:hypothetical protein
MDRSRYRQHLAASALVFERLQQGNLVAVKQLVGEERRSFGWDFLDGDAGASEDRVFAFCRVYPKNVAVLPG